MPDSLPDLPRRFDNAPWYGIILGVLLASVLVVTQWSPAVQAQSSARSRAELETLEKNIAALRRELEDSRKAAGDINAALREIEKDRADLSLKTRELEAGLKKLENGRAETEAALQRTRVQLADANDGLKQSVRASYVLSRSDGLKLALAANRSDDAFYNLALFRYLINAQQDKLDSIRQVRQDHNNALRESEAREVSIREHLDRLSGSRAALEKSEEQRAEELRRIKSGLSGGEAKMQALQRKHQELERLLKRLAREQSEKQITASSTPTLTPTPAPTQPTDSQPAARKTSSATQPDAQLVSGGFRRNRGRMLMPTRGKIDYRFGQQRPESGLTWEGIMVGVKTGQPVVAVYPGQVVFSDWFGGYGQLMVIDHGDGFMSLYGHNQTLHASIGDTVQAGQTIASAGDTGGLNRPGLYFEIRYNGQPDDPLKWVRL